MSVFGGVLLLLGAVYAALIGAFALGFGRVVRASRQPRSAAPAPCPFVTVIVPARDEEAVIARCLRSILAGDYPTDRFEVLVVDDLSEDDTDSAVARVQAEAPGRVRLLRMPENLERTRAHKKRAIEKGVAEARGTLIVTTDADCTVPPGWLRAMTATFDDAGSDPTQGPVTAFVSGPVLYRPGGGLFARLQALEFLGLVAVGAGAIGAGRPTICNGANVAYRKDVFEALGGFSGIDHLTSGDDELLMQRIHDSTPHRVRFCAAREAAVETDPAPSLAAFFQQRKRWASKGAHYPNKRLVALFVAIYLFYLGLLLGALALPVVPGVTPWLAGALAFKMIPEAALMVPACAHFGRLRLLALFLPEQLLHVPYIVVLAAAGALGHYEWKGRRVAR